jgi:CBS domain-containing protein
MYLYNLLQNLPSLASIIEPDPLTVYPDLPLLEAIAMMGQRSNEIAAPHSAMLVVANELLVGIVTDRDLLELTTTQADLQGLKVADVMTEQPHRLVLTGEQTVLNAVRIFQQYEIGHLPIVNAQGHLLGLVTIDLIRQIFQPTALLKSRSVGEEMTVEVIYTTAQAMILQVAQLMVEHGVIPMCLLRRNNVFHWCSASQGLPGLQGYDCESELVSVRSSLWTMRKHCSPWGSLPNGISCSFRCWNWIWLGSQWAW